MSTHREEIVLGCVEWSFHVFLVWQRISERRDTHLMFSKMRVLVRLFDRVLL